MKRTILLSTMLNLAFLYANAEARGKWWDEYTSWIDLPEGSEVGIGLLIAIVLIPIGYMLLNTDEKKNGTSENSFTGCLGLLLILGGICCLLPLLAWVFTIAHLAFGILFCLAIIVFVIVVVVCLIKK